jgi:transcription initiation factor TFIIB
VQARAHKLCSFPAVAARTSGRNPSGVAAACLYQAVRESDSEGGVRQSDLAAAARVTVVSLRSAWKAVEELSKLNDPASSETMSDVHGSA